MIDTITLQEEIDVNQKKIQSDSYPQSIREIRSRYTEWELIINPEFQRYFRWDKEKKSKLIESIFLWLPLPSFFVSTNENQEWELVDWLQRISTILEFMWELKTEHKTRISNENSIAEGLIEWDNFRYLKKLWNIKWEDLSSELKRAFYNYKLNFNILKVSTDKKVKYELFERLNTWWAQLSKQEIRNCIMIMENKDFYKFINDLAKNEDFQTTISSIGEKETLFQYDKELILRFFALRAFKDGDIITSVSKYMEDKMYLFLENFNYSEEKDIFEKTFSIINNTFWEDSFKKYYKEDQIFKRKVILPFYDILTLFVSNNLNLSISRLKQVIKEIWEEDDELSIIKKNIWVWPRIEAKLSFALKEWQSIFKKKMS